MVQIKQILRLRSQCSLSLNEIARTLHLSKGVVAKYVKLAQLAGLIWDDAKHLDEAALHQKLRSKQPQKAVPITALADRTNDHPNSVANVNVASANLATIAPPAAAQTPVNQATTPPEPTPQSAVPPAVSPTAESPFYPIDFAWLHQELKRKGVTRQLLWEEYSQQQQQQPQPTQMTLPALAVPPLASSPPPPPPLPLPSSPKRPYGYTRFCTAYRAWAKTVKKQLSMRQTHLAGDKMFVDYAGHTMPITNVVTGAVWQAQLFVAVLGASNYTFAYATATQTSADWIDAHVRALNFFGGVPILIVPDNARALIAAPDRYEPKVGLAYAEFAAHYGAAILPARPYKPQDKGKVEVAVQITERWILAVLRHRQFFSLAACRAMTKSAQNPPARPIFHPFLSQYARYLHKKLAKSGSAQPNFDSDCHSPTGC